MGAKGVLVSLEPKRAGGDTVAPRCEQEARELAGVPGCGRCGPKDVVPLAIGGPHEQGGNARPQIGPHDQAKAIGMDLDE